MTDRMTRFDTDPNNRVGANDLLRVNLMSLAWDDAAAAALRRDNQGFDQAMGRFHQLEGDCRSGTVAGAPAGLSRDASQAKPLIDYRKEADNGPR